MVQFTLKPEGAQIEYKKSMKQLHMIFIGKFHLKLVNFFIHQREFVILYIDRITNDRIFSWLVHQKSFTWNFFASIAYLIVLW
ncbi:MAG: hypothetical protein E7152_02655 [Enterococcus casseliflavus]|nr:hypothetical protein [Enterococcus casseliflavus]